MASKHSGYIRRFLHKATPFLFKECMAGNYHWWWEQMCWCRIGEYTDDWHGGVYVFKPCQELHTKTSCGAIVKAAAGAAYKAGRESCDKIHVILGDRATGKTSHAAAWVKESTDHHLSVMHERELRRLREQYGIPHNQLLTWNQEEHHRGRHGKVFFDNADLYLAEVARRYGFELGGWSASIGDNAVILDGNRVQRRKGESCQK